MEVGEERIKFGVGVDGVLYYWRGEVYVNISP
jgi:hypothetical protein